MSRLGDITNRLDTGNYIHQLDLKVTLFDAATSFNAASPYEIGWIPIARQHTRGITPSVWTFKVATVMINGIRTPASIANINMVADIIRPDEDPTYVKSVTHGIPLSLIPLIPSDRAELEVAQTPALPSNPAIPNIQVFQTNKDDLEFLGQYWLSNVGSAGLDGAIFTFADARYLNGFRVLQGQWHLQANGNNYDLIWAPYEVPVFNPDGHGNKHTAGNTSPDSRYKYAFAPDWYGSKGETTKFWTLWDIVNYLWAHGYVENIAWPTLDDPSWKLWYDHGGQQQIEVDLTNCTVVEAIDRVISAAGEYTWTLLHDEQSGDAQIKIIEYSRWYGYSGLDVGQAETAMPSRYVQLPVIGTELAATATNCIALTIDECTSERIGRLFVVGNPCLVETTLCTDGASDYACSDYGAGTPSNIATLEWSGDLASWKTAYRAASGTHEQRCKAASEASDEAYRLCSLSNIYRTSISGNGLKMFPYDNSAVRNNRLLLPYRLPHPSDGLTAASKAQKPNYLLWVRKPGASTWLAAGTKAFPSKAVGNFNIDPVVGGIRFTRWLVDYDTALDEFTAWDVRVTCCFELDERMNCEVYREGYQWKTATQMVTVAHGLAMRWNALQEDDVTVTSEVVYNDHELMREFANREFAKRDRFKTSGTISIPWIETFYHVGEFMTSARGTGNYSKTLRSAIVGIEWDYQTLTTKLRIENWRQ